MHDNACPIELIRNNAIMQIRNSKWKYALNEWVELEVILNDDLVNLIKVMNDI